MSIVDLYKVVPDHITIRIFRNESAKMILTCKIKDIPIRYMDCLIKILEPNQDEKLGRCIDIVID